MEKNPDGSGQMRENRLLEHHYLLMEGYGLVIVEDKSELFQTTNPDDGL